MIATITRLYYFGWIGWETRDVWLRHASAGRLPHDLLSGLYQGACLPGVVIWNVILRQSPGYGIFCTAAAFWIVLHFINKAGKRRAPRSRPSVLVPASLIGRIRHVTYYELWRD